jgi:hypothetical protein
MGLRFRDNGKVKDLDSCPEVTHLELVYVRRDHASISGQIWGYDAGGEDIFEGTFSLDAEGVMFLYPDDEDGWTEASRLEIVGDFTLDDITDDLLLRLVAEIF